MVRLGDGRVDVGGFDDLAGVEAVARAKRRTDAAVLTWRRFFLTAALVRGHIVGNPPCIAANQAAFPLRIKFC
jgi:hypothetical protein